MHAIRRAAAVLAVSGAPGAGHNCPNMGSSGTGSGTGYGTGSAAGY